MACLEDDPADAHATRHHEHRSDHTGCHSHNIKESKCDAVDPDEVARRQSHLTAQQQSQLAAVLHKFPKLFSGKLGTCPHRKNTLGN